MTYISAIFDILCAVTFVAGVVAVAIAFGF